MENQQNTATKRLTQSLDSRGDRFMNQQRKPTEIVTVIMDVLTLGVQCLRIEVIVSEYK